MKRKIEGKRTVGQRKIAWLRNLRNCYGEISATENEVKVTKSSPTSQRRKIRRRRIHEI